MIMYIGKYCQTTWVSFEKRPETAVFMESRYVKLFMGFSKVNVYKDDNKYYGEYA